MTDNPEDYVFRNLPLSYRHAGKDGSAYALTRVLGRALGEFERHTKQVLKSRFLDHLNDLQDAERLAALFELTPWADEELEAFRRRVKTMASIYLQGAATARRLLEVLGAAFEMEMQASSLPGTEGNDRYSTSGTFKHRDPDRTVTAKIVDLPITTNIETVSGNDYRWIIDNDLYAEPPAIDPEGIYTDGAGPDPVIDIAAGGRPLVLPVIVQQDLRRFLLINRFIPPGSVLRVDMRDHKLMDLSGPATLQGPLIWSDGSKPDLLYGSAGVSGYENEGRLSGDTTKTFHVLRWYDEVERSPGMPDIPEVPKPPDKHKALPEGKLPWPPMVSLGSTRWRLMRGVDAAGNTPELGCKINHTELRVRPLSTSAAPSKLVFRWAGRRLGTFTMDFDERLLWDLPQYSDDEKEHRRKRVAKRMDWVLRQMERLKLAGVMFLDQAAVGLNFPAPERSADPHLFLWENMRPADDCAVGHDRMERTVSLAEPMMISDSAAVNVGATPDKRSRFTEALEPADALRIEIKDQSKHLELSETVMLIDRADDDHSESDGKDAYTETLRVMDQVMLRKRWTDEQMEEELIMAKVALQLRGSVVLEVYAPDRSLISRTEVTNTVVDSGRRLLAMLLTGEAQRPVFSMVAGIGEKETTPDQTKLYDSDGMDPVKDVKTEMKGSDIILSGSFPPADKERYICEAGLMLNCLTPNGEESLLYNRVLITPKQIVRKEQVLTFTWTLQFARKE